jgi:hypothetical protein
MLTDIASETITPNDRMFEILVFQTKNETYAISDKI